MIIAMGSPIFLGIFRVMPWPIMFCSVLLPLLWPEFQKFFSKPDKQTTYLLLVKNGSMFLIAYILVYTLMVILGVGTHF